MNSEAQLRDVIFLARPTKLPETFITEFMNGDCRVMADFIAWKANDENFESSIIVMEDSINQFCHAFTEVIAEGQKYLIDARGAFSSIEELLIDFNLPQERYRSLTKHYHSGEFSRYQLDDLSFVEALQGADSYRALKERYMDEDTLHEYFFMYQHKAFSMLWECCQTSIGSSEWKGHTDFLTQLESQ